MIQIKSILHPTDFSPSSDVALELAASLARDHHARLVILHVARPPVTVMGAPTLEPPPADEWQRDDLEDMLHKRTVEGLSQEPEYRLDFSSSESDHIVKVAEETHCDVVVMGTHGRTGFKRLLLGSVAEHVVRKAHCPVLVVKSQAAANVGKKPASKKTAKSDRLVTVI